MDNTLSKRLVSLFLALSLCFFLAGIFLLRKHSNNRQEIYITVSNTETGTNQIDTIDMHPELITPEKLNDTHIQALDELSKEYGATSVSAAIIIDGRVAYHYEYGWADRESQKPMTVDAKVRVASLSKSILTIAFMTMCDDGEISIDTKMSEIFDNDNTAYSDVTMRALLAHAAGISENNALADGSYKASLSEELKMDKVFLSKPFSIWAYSNLGYDIVGAAIEKKSGILFQDYTADKIFRPMNLDASWDGSYISDSDLIASCYRTNGKKSLDSSYLAKGYERLDAGENYNYMAGGLIISAVDFARILTVLINDGQYGNTRILSPEAVENMQTVQDISTGLNFQQCLGLRYAENCYDGRNMYFHPGNAYGVLSIAAYDESDKSGVVIITNGAELARDEYSNYTVCSDMLNYIYQNIIDKSL